MKVGAPLSSAKSGLDPVGAHRHLAAVDAVLQVTLGAPPVATRHRFLSDFVDRQRRGRRGRRRQPSTLRSYSRTRYEPGVHTAIISSTSARPRVGIDAATST